MADHLKIYAYDFDKTLTLTDTTLPFLLFAQPLLKRWVRRLHYYATSVLVKLSIWTTATHKDHWLRCYFKGWSAQNWALHCQAFAKHIQLHPLFQQTDWLANDRTYIVLTASPVDWVRPLFPPQVLVFGSEIAFGPKGLQGLGLELSGASKLAPLQQRGILQLESFYTDHPNDRPVAALAKSIFLVRGLEVIPCADLAAFDKMTKN